jgi:hypothetical protein
LFTNCNRLPQTFAVGDRYDRHFHQIFIKYPQKSLSKNASIPVLAAVSAIPEKFTKIYKKLLYFVGVEWLV